MNHDPKKALDVLFPMPAGIRVHSYKLGANPISPLVPVSVQGESSEPRPEFKICWDDQQLGVTVLVQEREDGHLIANAFCTNANLLNKGAVSVGLVGTGIDHRSAKVIPLVVPEKTGCSGSADLGPLSGAVKELGTQLGVVVILLV